MHSSVCCHYVTVITSPHRLFLTVWPKCASAILMDVLLPGGRGGELGVVLTH